MADKTVLSMNDRLAEIVDRSYVILCNKVATGGIEVPNEASLQLHLGVILKQLGQLYELNTDEHFLIEMESPQTCEQFQKSGTGKARCDIFIKLKKGKKEAGAAIELKHFKYSKNEAVTDNRFAVFLDLKNLEDYRKNYNDLLCYEIVYTDNENYTLPNRSKFELAGNIGGTYTYTKDRVVTLNNNYNAEWDCYKDKCYKDKGHYFLKISF